jgi:hypothetical protein
VRNPYSTELADLRDYLKAGYQAYDFAHLLEGFFDAKRGGVTPNWFDPNEPEARIDQLSAKDAKDFKDYAIYFFSDATAPSTAFFDYEGLVKRNTWLAHLTNDIEKIKYDGLECGHDDMYTLGLTTHFIKKDCKPGWNFAFEANSRDLDRAIRQKKYGEDIVLFQSAGVKAYHSGDEEHQIIFLGSRVEWFIPLHREGGNTFRILSSHSDRVVVEGEYDDVFGWVKKNYRQYFKAIAYARKEKP